MNKTQGQGRKLSWRLMSMALILALLTSLLPVSALGTDVSSSDIQRHQTAWLGTAEEDLPLPSSIDGQPVTWSCTPGYDPRTPGLYIFTADNEEGTVISMLTRSPIQPAAYGLGTAAVPLEICTAQQLKELAVLVNKGAPEGYIDVSNAHIKLTGDIDLSGMEWTPIGTAGKPFSGTLDGNGHVIRNLTINMTDDDQGLFGYVDGGVIENLGLVEFSISLLSNGSNVGGLAGTVSGASQIQSCYVTGSINGSDHVGGLVGTASENSQILDCYVSGSVSGESYVGGVAGHLSADSEIRSCYATGTVSFSNSYFGGIVGGIADGTVANCVALNASVSGKDGGRVAGTNGAHLSDNYAWSGLVFEDANGTATIPNDPADIHGADVSAVSISSGADFWQDTMEFDNSVWTIQTNALPILRNAGSSQSSAIPDYLRDAPIVDPVTGLDGLGSAVSPFLIQSVADLQFMGQKVNAGEAAYNGTNVYYQLTTDLDLSGLNWTPIGSYSIADVSKAFKANFDGAGYVLSNLTIDNNTTDHLGLFGYVYEGSIENLGLENVSINGNNRGYIGGVAGEISSGTIHSCYVTGAIIGSSCVGGVAGYAKNGSTISNSYVSASVSGTGDYVGGVTGDLYGMQSKPSKIIDSYTVGTVSGTGNYVGGVTGSVSSKCEIQGCAALNPSVTATGNINNVGRVAGPDGGATLQDNYAWSGMVLTDSGGAVTAITTGKTTIHGADAQPALIVDGTIWGSSYLNFDPTVWSIDTGKLPILKDVGNGQDRAIPTYIAGLEKNIQGVYLIQSVTDLEHMAQQVNTGKSDYVSAEYLLTTDLDLDGRNWPHRSFSSSFTGTFDGNGKVIRKLTIQNTTSDYQGLFGYVDGGTVKNLILERVNITSSNNNVGGVVGYLTHGGMISGCSVTGTITGNSTVGGIAGRVTNAFDTGSSVTHCSTAVQCVGKNYVGGIAGNVMGSDVAYCYSTGIVVGTSTQVGGIAGNLQTGSIDNCYATGDVISTGGTVGGVVGNVSQSQVTNSYATGNISGTTNIGGVAGMITANSVVHNCYATGSVSGDDNVGGVVGYNNGSTITHCVTIGARVRATGGKNVNRIAFHESTGTNIQHNYAFDGMTVIAMGDPTTNGNNGDDVTGRDALSADFWAQLDFDSTLWTLEDGYLPALKDVGGSQKNTGGQYLGIFPLLEGEVTLSGQAVVGRTLTAVTQQSGTSTLSAFPRPADAGLGDLSYIWYRDEAEIGGANASHYLLTQGDEGKQITVAVSSEHTTGWVTSLPSDPVSNSQGGGGSTYTVSFETNGGSRVNSQQVSYNATLKQPTDPTREGYVFTGWFTDSSLTTTYDFTSKVTKSFTLYAGWREAGASDDKHPAYINGYPDGTFRPEGSLNRAEAATLLYRLIDNRVSAGSSVPDFSDVPSGTWYSEAVMELASRGIIRGYADGSFRPDAAITRAEFVTMALRFAGLDGKEGSSGFSDVTESHWAAMYIAEAVAAEYIYGYPDGTFRPENSVSRAEAVTILNRVIGCVGLQTGKTFTDVPEGYWAFEAITGAATGHNHE